LQNLFYTAFISSPADTALFSKTTSSSNSVQQLFAKQFMLTVRQTRVVAKWFCFLKHFRCCCFNVVVFIQKLHVTNVFASAGLTNVSINSCKKNLASICADIALFNICFYLQLCNFNQAFVIGWTKINIPPAQILQRCAPCYDIPTQ
jgi:hypothetical protein